MARELESKEVAAVVLNVIVPGAGHLIADRIPVGLFFLVGGLAAGWWMTPLWFAVGAAAAVQLFIALRSDEPSTRESLLPPREARPSSATTKPEPEAKPKREAKPEPEPIEVPVSQAEESEPAPEEPAAEEPAVEEPGPPVLEETGPTTTQEILLKPMAKAISADRYPHEIERLDKKLAALKGTMGVAKQWHDTHFGLWNETTPRIAEGAPELLVEIANELGAIEFEAFWSYGWKFAHDDTVALFNVIEPVDIGWRFGHRTADSGSLELIWLPNNSVVRRSGDSTLEFASSLGQFVEQLENGLRVAQMSLAAEALMDPKQLTVLPAEEREESEAKADVEFRSFWMGAEGPGLLDVWFEIAPPWIEHAEGSRVADAMDAAIIDAFAEWLDTEPESAPGAMELAEKRSAHERPVAWITRDDEILVAWWVETPPGEVDAFLDHLRSLVYYKG